VSVPDITMASANRFMVRDVAIGSDRRVSRDTFFKVLHGSQPANEYESGFQWAWDSLGA
jgi:hypothetical protein